MLEEARRIHKQFQGFLEYSNSMASLWLQYTNKTIEQANNVTQALINFQQTLINPYPSMLDDAAEYITDFIHDSFCLKM